MNNNSSDKIGATGEWWHYPWWEDPKYLSTARDPVERIRELIDVLKEAFPADWAKQIWDNPRLSVVMPMLIGRGHPDFRNLIYLGRIIEALRGMRGYSEVLRRLKENESYSAFFEFQMAYAFAEKKIQVEFPQRAPSKIPDILAFCSDTPVEIECKYLNTEEWEQWERELTQTIMHEVMDVTHRHDFAVQIELNPRIADIRFDEKRYPQFNDSIMRGIVETIRDKVIEKLAVEKLPVELEIDGLKMGRILPQDAQSHSSVSGAEISGVAKLRRIFTNAISMAAEQLSGKSPGVVCVYSDFVPEPGLTRVVLDALTSHLNARFAAISALMLFPMQTVFEHHAPLLLENKFARFPFSSLQAKTVFVSAFDPRIT